MIAEWGSGRLLLLLLLPAALLPPPAAALPGVAGTDSRGASKSSGSFSPQSAPAVLVQVDAAAAGRPFAHYWKRSFGSGHASLGLRPDWQAALARAASDYGLAGIRQHGLFDDDMDIASRAPGSQQIVYNFSKLDLLWDAHVKHGVHPVVELSFMPWALANCSSAAYPQPELPGCPPQAWVRTGWTGPPRRWSDWHELVKHTVAHAVARYGLREVQKWSFEVWK
jgi:xylan 1,4-beta-xylosidase